jgi:predicted TIM-barrel fold metal-dependent hydrolase
VNHLTGKVDVHHHLIPDDYRAALARRNILDAGGRPLPPWSVRRSLDVMDENAITLSLLSISTPGVWIGDGHDAYEIARACNEEGAEIVREHPRRFGLLASLPILDPELAVEELRYAFDDLDADGVVLLSSSAGEYLGTPILEPVYEELNRRRAAVLIHPTRPTWMPDVPLEAFTLEFVVDTTRAAANLVFRGVTERFPDIRWILSHAGGVVPFIGYRLQRGWKGRPDAVEAAPRGALSYLREMYFDTALSASPWALPALLDFAGPDRVLLGTDFPFVQPPAVEEQSGALEEFLDSRQPGVRSAIESGNALTLFPTVAERLELQPRG